MMDDPTLADEKDEEDAIVEYLQMKCEDFTGGKVSDPAKLDGYKDFVEGVCSSGAVLRHLGEPATAWTWLEVYLRSRDISLDDW